MANRDRTKFGFGVGYQPMDNLLFDVNYRYANDDYSKSKIGLTESKDTGYDLSVNYQPIEDLNLSLTGGQQWINSTQKGSQNFSKADWKANVKNNFKYIGLGAEYAGLFEGKSTVGVNYSYNKSESDTTVTGRNKWDDYFDWSHNLKVFTTYQFSESTEIRADYRYIDHYDTSYKNVSSNAIGGLVTLGDLSNSYNAHQLMFTLSHKFGK